MDLERPPTEFERKVFDALHLIPRGKVTTYGLLGRYISCRSAQAIGQDCQAGGAVLGGEHSYPILLFFTAPNFRCKGEFPFHATCCY